MYLGAPDTIYTAPNPVNGTAFEIVQQKGSANRLKEGVDMSTSEELYTLCSVCIHARGCVYLVYANQQQVLHCEEFACYPSRPGKSINPGHDAPSDSGVNKPAMTSTIRGLCRLCSGQGNCDFPKPEGGVWHCEEYN